jgi:hypothetical protein
MSKGALWSGRWFEAHRIRGAGCCGAVLLPAIQTDAGNVWSLFSLLLIAWAIPRNVHSYWVISTVDVALALNGTAFLNSQREHAGSVRHRI